MINRETINAGLFDKLKAAAKFNTADRRLKHWSDVAPADMPAMFLAYGKTQDANRRPGFDAVWILRFDVWLYVHTNGDRLVSPSQLMNPLLDSIEALLKPDNPGVNKCTLGGLVEHAWIEGSVETDEGALGDIGVAVVPIAVLVPSA